MVDWSFLFLYSFHLSHNYSSKCGRDKSTLDDLLYSGHEVEYTFARSCLTKWELHKGHAFWQEQGRPRTRLPTRKRFHILRTHSSLGWQLTLCIDEGILDFSGSKISITIALKLNLALDIIFTRPKAIQRLAVEMNSRYDVTKDFRMAHDRLQLQLMILLSYRRVQPGDPGT